MINRVDPRIQVREKGRTSPRAGMAKGRDRARQCVLSNNRAGIWRRARRAHVRDATRRTVAGDWTLL